MNLNATDFELFGLPPRFEQNAGALDQRWRELQAQVHPDNFAVQGAASQRVAMQWAVRVNEAHQRLKDPLKRAAYLCELNGVPIEAHDNTVMPADFLMHQMYWREALEEADGLPQVEQLAQDVSAHRTELLRELSAMLDERQDFRTAAQQVRALMFVERFRAEVDARLEALGQ